jgi:hypothetical protein
MVQAVNFDESKLMQLLHVDREIAARCAAARMTEERRRVEGYSDWSEIKRSGWRFAMS